MALPRLIKQETTHLPLPLQPRRQRPNRHLYLYRPHQQWQISSHPHRDPTTPIQDITNSPQVNGQPTIKNTTIPSSHLPRRKKRRMEMDVWADIGKNSIRKEQTLLILMFRKAWRRLGSRGRGGKGLSSPSCRAMRLNTRWVAPSSYSFSWAGDWEESLCREWGMLTIRRLDRSKVWQRNAINSLLYSIQLLLKRKR